MTFQDLSLFHRLALISCPSAFQDFSLVQRFDFSSCSSEFQDCSLVQRFATGHGRREGGEIINTCYVMVGGRVVKVSIPATGHGRRQGGKISLWRFRIFPQTSNLMVLIYLVVCSRSSLEP